jgi:hypothetical protein
MDSYFYDVFILFITSITVLLFPEAAAEVVVQVLPFKAYRHVNLYVVVLPRVELVSLSSSLRFDAV